MKNRSRTLLLLSIIFLASCQQNPDVKSFQPGYANLSDIDFNSGDISKLNGRWFYWPDQLLMYEDVKKAVDSGYSTFSDYPKVWQKLSTLENKSELQTTGTLALKLTLPQSISSWAIRLPNANSATSLFLNDRLIAQIGNTSETKEQFIPSNKLKVANFYSIDQHFYLIVHVANFSTPYTGTWDSLTIGRIEDINSTRILNIILTSLISGALFYMALYHLTLFILRKDDKSTLWFALISLIMGIRNMIMGERILLELLPEGWFWWRVGFNIEHLSAHMVLPLFFLFLGSIFPRQLHKKVTKIVCFIAILWACLQVFTPIMFHHRFLAWYEYFIVISTIYMLTVIARAFIAKEEGAKITIIGLLLLLTTIVNDVLLSSGVIESFYMCSIGLFIYTFSQSILLSKRFTNLFNIIATYTKDLKELNSSLERFIPHKFLEFLGKRSIVDVKLGDYSKQNMSVFFLDIRDFTTFSETMSPHDNFAFINSFLNRFGPIIRQNGGFVDKYIGDGIMALFPDKPDQALNAALSIRDELLVFNSERVSYGLIPIHIGIGINTGDLMLGTIGENQRMDSTVISDAVNTASRLETLTKEFNVDILVSETSVQSLQDIKPFKLTHTGSQKVKGKSELIEIYSLDRSII